MITYDVAMRYVFLKPTSWSLEISEFMLTGIVFLAVGYALLVGAHVRVDMVLVCLPRRVQLVMNIATGVLSLVACGVLIWQSAFTAREAIVGGWVTTSPAKLPLWPSYILIPLGVVLLAIQWIIQICEYVISLRTGQTEPLIHPQDWEG